MRPHKHVGVPRGTQQVLAIALDRLVGEDGEVVPLAATTEIDAITLFWWDHGTGAWGNVRLPHEPITAPPDGVNASDSWNWSERVGLASSAGRVFLVYKRELSGTTADPTKRTGLFLDVFEASEGESGDLVRLAHSEVPLDPTPVAPPGSGLPGSSSPPSPPVGPPGPKTTPGFSLWAGVTRETNRLLILAQRLHEEGGVLRPRLTLLAARLDQPLPFRSWSLRDIDDGGYDLDARLDGATLFAVYRRAAVALSVDGPRFELDDPERTRQVLVTSGPEADPLYEPLQLATIDLASSAVDFQRLPGGEHPQIQATSPLFITADRQASTAVRFHHEAPRLGRAPRVFIQWAPTRIDKLALILLGSRLHRGILTSFSARPFPRVLHALARAQNLFEAGRRLRYRSTFGPWPFPLVQRVEGDKGPVVDFLHHLPFLGLARSRFALRVAGGEIEVLDSGFELWDINHAEIGPPASLQPPANAETTQFAPFGFLIPATGVNVGAEAFTPDNTLGGAVTTVPAPDPWKFFAYTDMGDGGLRVIFDADLPGPGDVSLPERPKDLVPELVPGPGSSDELWIEIDAAGWIPGRLPGYTFGPSLSIASALHARLDSLLGAARLEQGVNPSDGLDGDELDRLEMAAVDLLAPSDAVLSNPADPPLARFTFLPRTIVRGFRVAFDGSIDGDPAAQLAWTATFIDPSGPGAGDVTSEFEGSSHYEMTFDRAGSWQVAMTARRADGISRTAIAVVDVAPSLADVLWSLYDGVATGGSGPANGQQASPPPYRLGPLKIDLLKYELEFTPAPDDRSRVLKITEIPAGDPRHDTQMRFLGHGFAQGEVDYRLPIRARADHVELTGMLGNLVSVRTLEVRLLYHRRFTPGVLMLDRREVDPVTGASRDTLHGTKDSPAALAAKPCGSSRLEATVQAPISLTPQGMVLASLIAALPTIGGAVLAATLAVLAGAQAAAIAAGIGGVVAVGVIAAVVVAVIVLVVTPFIRSWVERTIHDRVTSPESRQRLDDANLLQFAGEGLAEALARKVVEAAIAAGGDLDPPGEADDAGRDRFRAALFQTVLVTAGKCRVLIRLP